MGKQLKDIDVDDRQVARVEAIIRSMTPQERRDPKVLNGRRRKRIAAGSGTTVTEVNRLVKQFDQVQKLMKSAAKMAGQSGAKPQGVKGARAQAAAVRQMQQQLGGGGPAGLGGFSGLQPAPKRKR
jgi:signal recognition particle subunit SRP54